jgi:hypothetical protein
MKVNINNTKSKYYEDSKLSLHLFGKTIKLLLIDRKKPTKTDNLFKKD